VENVEKHQIHYDYYVLTVEKIVDYKWIIFFK